MRAGRSRVRIHLAPASDSLGFRDSLISRLKNAQLPGIRYPRSALNRRLRRCLPTAHQGASTARTSRTPGRRSTNSEDRKVERTGFATPRSLDRLGSAEGSNCIAFVWLAPVDDDALF